MVFEKVCFATSSRSLTLEGTPLIIDALEKVALSLGAQKDECNCHKFTFNSNRQLQNELSLIAIENIWGKLAESNSKKITIHYMDNVLYLEGDDERFKVFIAFIKSLGKEIHTNEVTFSKNELCSFYAAYNIAEKLEIIPV